MAKINYSLFRWVSQRLLVTNIINIDLLEINIETFWIFH